MPSSVQTSFDFYQSLVYVCLSGWLADTEPSAFKNEVGNIWMSWSIVCLFVRTLTPPIRLPTLTYVSHIGQKYIDCQTGAGLREYDPVNPDLAKGGRSLRESRNPTWLGLGYRSSMAETSLSVLLDFLAWSLENCYLTLSTHG